MLSIVGHFTAQTDNYGAPADRHESLLKRATPSTVTGCKPRIPAPAGVLCGKRGSLSSPVLMAAVANTNTFAACRDACESNPRCISFGFGFTDGQTCQRYKKPILSQGFVKDTKSLTSFYNRKCFDCSSSTPPTPSSTTSTATTTSSTSSSTSRPLATCNPPAATISGVAAMDFCNDNFDGRLDSSIGFFDTSTDDYLATFAPGLDQDGLQKRGLFSFAKKLAKAVIKVATAPARAVLQVAKKIITEGPKYLVKIVKAVVNLIQNPGVRLYFPAYFQFPQYDFSPWGYAYKVFQYIPKNPSAADTAKAKQKSHEKDMLPNNFGDKPGVAFYCKDCGIKAFFTVSGTVHFSLLHGFSDGQLKATGDFYAGINIGMHAVYIIKKKLGQKKLLHKGFPGFEIPGIIIVGPELSVDAEASIEVKAEGQLLVGANMTMPNAVAVLSLTDSKKSYQSGWTPQYTKTFQAHGEIAAGLVFELPIGLAFGVSMFSGKFKKQVAVVNTPSLEFEAKMEVNYSTTKVTYPNGTEVYITSPSDPASLFGSEECPGIGLEVSIQDKLDADLFGVRGYRLWHTSVPVAEACITLWTRPTDAPSSTVTTAGNSVTTTGLSSTPTPSSSGPNDLANGLKYFDYPDSVYDSSQTSFRTDLYNSRTNWASSGVEENLMPDLRSQGPWLQVFTRIYQGYFVARAAGTYYFSSNLVDDWLLIWWGVQAHTSYTNANVNWMLPLGNGGQSPGLTLTAGQMIPITILMSNGNGPAGFDFAIVDPDGNQFSDTTGWFKYSPSAGYNDGGDTHGGFLPGIKGYHFNYAVPSTYGSDFDTTQLIQNKDFDSSSVYSTLDSFVSGPDGMHTYVFQGYFLPKKTGYYSLSAQLFDNLVAVWWLDPASHSNWNQYNVFLSRWYQGSARTSGQQYFVKGIAAPITILWANMGGPGTLQLQLTDPDDLSSTQTSDWFVYDPTESFSTARSTQVVSLKRQLQKAVRRQDSNTTPTDVTPNDVNPTDVIPTATTTDPGLLTPTETSTADADISGVLTDVTDATDADFDTTDNTVYPADVPDDEAFTWPDLDADYALAIADQPTTPTDSTTGNDAYELQYANIVDTTGAVQLHAGDDNNLYLSSVDSTDGSGLFDGYENVYTGDSQMRTFVYYPDAMSTFGASRFRVVPDDSVPTTARPLGLAPVDDGSGGWVYVATALSGDMYFLFACNFDNQNSKLFLVADYDTAEDTLTKQEVAWTVTGGNPTDCGSVALKAAGGPGQAVSASV